MCFGNHNNFFHINSSKTILAYENAKKHLTKLKNEKPETEIPEEIKKLIEERNVARQNKDWAKSDEIRDKITSNGYSIKDTKDGIIVEKM